MLDRLPNLEFDPRRKGEQLQDVLEDVVATAEPGQQLPSERRLADHYGVARMTVRGVIDTLVMQGLVYRSHGRGTFVAAPRVEQPEHLTSFSQDMAARGMVASSIVLSQELVPAGPVVAPAVGVAPHDPVVRIERIRRGDGEPIAIERAHLSSRRYPGLEDVDLRSASLYETLARHYDCQVAESEQIIAAVNLTEAEAHLLHTEHHAPALRIERRTRSATGEPVEYVRALYRGDRYELHSRLTRSQAQAPPEEGQDP